MLSRAAKLITNPAQFLKQIGRSTSQYATKFESLDSLVNSTGSQLKNLGIETRQRKYLLSQREKFKQELELRRTTRGRKIRGGERKRKANGEK